MTEKLEQEIERSVTACCEHLDRTKDALRERGEPAAADCAGAITLLLRQAIELEREGTRGRFLRILSVAELCAQARMNGFGDSVIWPGYRRSGLHRDCEEWTRLTNELRTLRQKYFAEHDPCVEDKHSETAVEIAVLVRNAAGELEFFNTCIVCSRAELDEGKHFDLVEPEVLEAGYESPMEFIGPFEPAGRTLGLRTGEAAERAYNKVANRPAPPEC